MSDGSRDEEVNQWLEECRERQENYYGFLGRYSWIQYNPSEYVLLKRNIGFALFGCPSEPDDSNELTGYDENQLKLVDKMFNLIVRTGQLHKDRDNLWVAFIYVCCKIGNNCMEVPVIRVPKYDPTSVTNENIFIDSSFRVYQNWQDFLKNNKLPDCLMCYPNEGRYFKVGNQLQLGGQVSPAGKVAAKVLRGFDISSSVVGTASTVIGAAALFVPVAWPILIGAAGVGMVTGGYTAARSITRLRDRDVHQQSIALDNAESLNCYFGIVSGAVGFASIGTFAAAGSIAAATAAGRGTAAGTGVAMAAGTAAAGTRLITHAAKRSAAEGVGANGKGLDILHMTSSVLFFGNSVISNNQAHMLVKIVAKDNTSILSEISNLTNHNARSDTEIRNIIHCENLPSIVGIVCQYVCKKLFEICILYLQGEIESEEYRRECDIYLGMLWNSWNEEIHVVTDVIHDFLQQVKSHISTEEFEQNPKFMDKFAKEVIAAMKDFQKYIPTSSDMDVELAERLRDLVISTSIQFADQLQCKSPHGFVRLLKFTIRFIKDEFNAKKDKYDRDLQIATELLHGITVQEFDRINEIPSNHSKYFLGQIKNDFADGNGFSQLRIAYERQNSSSTDEEIIFMLSDEDDFRAIEFDYEKGLTLDGWLDRNQYFEIASRFTGRELDETNALLQENGGNAIMEIRIAEKMIFIKTKKTEDSKISGIAVMLNNCP